MKKVFKRIIMVLVVLIFLVISAASIAIWFVFTPERLTPVVRTQVADYLTCKSEIGRVELTFFSTFPRFGLKISQFALINSSSKAQSDTLVSTEQLVGVIDVAAWWKKDELVLTEVQLQNGVINAFIDSLGQTNFSITKPDTIAIPADTSKSEMPFKFINIENVALKNINLTYNDQQGKMQAEIRNLTAQISGSLNSDSLKTTMNVSSGIVTFSYEGEKYFNKTSFKLNVLMQIILSKELVRFIQADAMVNDIPVAFSGTIDNDTIHQRINFDIAYQSKPFPLPSALALIPPSYQSYIKGVNADGIATSDGKITGFYSDTQYPLMDMHMVLHNGTMKYDGFSIPLSQMEGDAVFYSDLTNDAITYFRINSFSAKTPQSSFKTNGLVTGLFSDIHCDLASEANLNLAEFAPLIPANLKTKVKGNVTGNVRSTFSMSQMEKMLLDKIRISGSVSLSNFDAAYDSISLKTDLSRIDFALPNPNPASAITKFAFLKVNSKSLEASKLASYRALLQNALISLEVSDARDTTRIPNVACTFALDSLAASMDTIKLGIRNPSGKFTLTPVKGSVKQPEIKMEYGHDHLETFIGSSSVHMNKTKLAAEMINDLLKPKYKLSYSGDLLEINMGSNRVNVNKIQLNTDVVNDKTQKDAYAQWQVKGFVDMDNGIIAMSALTYPLEIPSIKMNFDPEVMDIKESKLRINRSDFSLSGTLSNVLSYFKKDSLLRGNFNFISNTTDVRQLMNLSSGLGESAENSMNKTAPKTDTVAAPSTGPYMVPKGIDILLRASIKNATIGSDTAKNIIGDVRVKDGTLILDGLRFTTPAAKMQLTMMYRTPRKNHLYAYIDYHMLDVQIESLLKMIPDIDSIMPMLKSFKGKGEFHLAAETYLDSLYAPKKSTIRAASYIRGQDLVLMDGSTFSEISKKLKFNKKTTNKVDSLSVEFTVFKQEIDIYPFLIVMDKYKAVIGGRHNMDMSFDYNISLVDSPLPIKLAVDVKGTMDNLKYNLARSKYPELYRPASRGIVKDRQLELRKIIREALIQKVKKAN
jgi:hypothetical protein